MGNLGNYPLGVTGYGPFHSRQGGIPENAQEPGEYLKEMEAMSEEVPDWAMERAEKLIRKEDGLTPRKTAFARYIAKHEQPPVDPDVLAVREILAAHHSGLRLTSEEYRTGFYDKHEQFQAALVAYRKHKEAGE